LPSAEVLTTPYLSIFIFITDIVNIILLQLKIFLLATFRYCFHSGECASYKNNIHFFFVCCTTLDCGVIHEA